MMSAAAKRTRRAASFADLVTVGERKLVEGRGMAPREAREAVVCALFVEVAELFERYASLDEADAHRASTEFLAGQGIEVPHG